MPSSIEIDEELMVALDERARHAGTSSGALAETFIRQGLERAKGNRRDNSTESSSPLRRIASAERPRLENGLPQLFLQAGTEISLDSLPDILSAIEADDDLGPPLAVDQATRAEIIAHAHEQDIRIGLLASDVLQQSLLLRNEWPSWRGIPQFPIRGRNSYSVELIEQLKDELD